MKIENAAAELEKHLAQRGEVESALTPSTAIASMTAFYRDVRAEECDLETDGDMLLFQWGTYDSGHGPRFELDITRQFIVGGEDDDAIKQLHVTFRFKPDEFLLSLAAGDRWCRTPQELADFTSFIEGHPAYHAVGSRTDGEKDFLYEGV
jgi:hypothetical protein